MNRATTCSHACPVSIPPSPKCPFPFTASLAPTHDLPPRSLSLNFTFWRCIHSHSLESHPSKCFPLSPSSLNVVTSTPKSQENTAGWCSRMWSFTHKKPCPTGEALLGSLCTRGHDRAEREGPAEETTHSGERGKQKEKKAAESQQGVRKIPSMRKAGL